MTFNTRMIVVKWYEITNIYIYMWTWFSFKRYLLEQRTSQHIYIYIYIQPMKNIYMHSSVLYIYTHSKKLNNIYRNRWFSTSRHQYIYIYKQTYIYIYICVYTCFMLWVYRDYCEGLWPNLIIGLDVCFSSFSIHIYAIYTYKC